MIIIVPGCLLFLRILKTWSGNAAMFAIDQKYYSEQVEFNFNKPVKNLSLKIRIFFSNSGKKVLANHSFFTFFSPNVFPLDKKNAVGIILPKLLPSESENILLKFQESCLRIWKTLNKISILPKGLSGEVKSRFQNTYGKFWLKIRVCWLWSNVFLIAFFRCKLENRATLCYFDRKMS